MEAKESEALRREIESLKEQFTNLEREVRGRGTPPEPSESPESKSTGSGPADPAAPPVAPATGEGKTKQGNDGKAGKDEKGKEDRIGEQVRAALAFFVVFFILSILAIVWFVLGIQDVERASTFLLSLVTLVLGYHFGSKGTQAAQTRVDEARVDLEEAKRTRRRLRKQAMDELRESLSILEKRKEEIRKRKGGG